MTLRKHGRLQIDWETALGASRVVPVGSGGLSTPIDLLALRAEVSSLISLDQRSLVEANIPLPEETWVVLQEMSQQLKDDGIRATPERLAAHFIEQGILRCTQPAKK